MIIVQIIVTVSSDHKMLYYSIIFKSGKMETYTDKTVPAAIAKLLNCLTPDHKSETTKGEKVFSYNLDRKKEGKTQ